MSSIEAGQPEEFTTVSELLYGDNNHPQTPERRVLGEFSPVTAEDAYAVIAAKPLREYTDADYLTLQGLEGAISQKAVRQRSDGMLVGVPTLAGDEIDPSVPLSIRTRLERSRKPLGDRIAENSSDRPTPPYDPNWRDFSSRRSHKSGQHSVKGDNMLKELVGYFTETEKTRSERGKHRAGRGKHHTHEKSAPYQIFERAQLVARKFSLSMMSAKLSTKLSYSLDALNSEAEQERASARLAIVVAVSGGIVMGYLLGREHPDIVANSWSGLRDIFTDNPTPVDAAEAGANLGLHGGASEVVTAGDANLSPDVIHDEIESNLEKVVDVLEKGGLIAADAVEAPEVPDVITTPDVHIDESLNDLPESRQVNDEAPGITYHMLADAQALGFDVNGWDIYDKVYTIMEAEGYMTKEHISGVGLYDMHDGDVGFRHVGEATYSEEFLQRQIELFHNEFLLQHAEKAVNG